MQDKREVSIIIVNYNKYELTQKCIKSVCKNVINIKYEIIVLDNASTNNSFETLKKKYKNDSHINVIKNEKNTGFGDGNNKAVKLAKYKNILLLNPDVIVLENSIEKMLNKLDENVNYGVLGCMLLNGDNTLQYSCRRFLPFKDFIKARTPLKILFSKNKIEVINNKYLMKEYNHNYEKSVDWIMGSCLLLRKSDFEDVGGFSKEYFMYFEDVDLCYKMKKSGKEVVYLPDAKMIHLHEQESVKKISKLTIVHLNSMFKFYKKFKGEII